MRIKIIHFIVCLLVLTDICGQDCEGVSVNARLCDSVLMATDVVGLIAFIDSVNVESEKHCSSDYELRLDNLCWGGYTMLSKGYYNSTIEIYKRVQQEARLHQDTIYDLYMQAYIGNSNLFKGDFQEVIDVMNEGYGRLLASNIEEPYLQGFYPHIIGDAYRYLGEYEQALKYLNIALPILHSTESDMLGSNYLAMADVSIKQEQFVKAKKQLLEITETKIENMFNHGWGHAIYRSLSKVVAAEGKYKEAIKFLEYAESSLVDTSRWSIQPSIAMYEKAAIHVQFENAIEGERESLRALAQLGITDWRGADYTSHPNLQYVLSSLSTYAKVVELQLSQDEDVEKRVTLDKLYQQIFGVIELLLQDFSSRRGASIWRDYNYLYTSAIDNAFHLYDINNNAEYLSRGLAYSVRSKSQELINKRRELGRKHLPADIAGKVEVVQARLNKVKLSMLEAKVAGDAIGTAASSAEYAEIKAEISVLELPFKPKQPIRELGFEIDLQEISLDEDQAKLEIYESTDRWDVWTITAESISWSRHDKSKDWDAMATHYSKHVGNKYDFGELQNSLSFLTDIICDLSGHGIGLITVIGDKTLSTIPLDLLYNCSDTDFVSSLVSFNSSYSLLDLGSSHVDQEVIDYEYSVLAWAPTYGSLDADKIEDELVAELVRSGNYNLPGAQLEALTISAILDGISIMGEKATKTSFFENIGKSRVLHLSMHALMNRKEGDLSKFLFSNETEGLTSSYLHAFELEKLSLTAELAVLSACETGLGPIDDGEGVMSLARSFAMAGVPSTVMTLWQVPDKSSSAIMTLFYRFLKEGQGKVDALSNAKKEYVRTCVDDGLKHPYYWAGFVVIGNNKPIVETDNNLPFKYPLYVLLALGVGFTTKRLLHFA